MRRNRALSIVVLTASVLNLLSCGGGGVSSTPTPLPTSSSSSSAPTVVSISPTPTSGSTSDCGAAWLASLDQLSKLSPSKKIDNIEIVSWNDYESGSQIEAGVDNCVSITPSLTGTTLSWQALGNTATIDHYAIFASPDGETLTSVATLPVTSSTVDVAKLDLPSASEYTFFVQAVGKPSVLNKVSPAVKYRKNPVPPPNQPPVAALTVSPNSGAAPLTVTASTSGSSDPDGTIASVIIDFGDGTVINAASGTHTYNTAGTYTLKATITDNAGATAADTKSVTATAAAPPSQPPPPTVPPSQNGVQILPSSATIYVNGIQSLTAQVAGIVDQRVTWTAPGATIIGSGSTVGIKSGSVQNVSVTATSVADPSKTATVTVKFVTAPTPRTDHPRIWITSADVPRLRSWASNSNPGWKHGTNGGLYYALTQAQTILDAHWTWSFNGGTGLPDTQWTTWDTGSNNFPTYNTEAFAAVLAFGSIVAPDQASRDAYGQRARDLLMWVMNQYAANGYSFASGQPFRDPHFPTSDRIHGKGWCWGAAVDWLQAGSYLSTADKSIIRKVFLVWAKAQLTSGVTSHTYPLPVGAINTPSVLTTAPLRWALNNHSIGQFRALALDALALDAADDPCTNSTVNSDGSADCMRAYIPNVQGAWVYRLWANFEDANIVGSAYGISPTGLGSGAGGLGVEGSLYDESIGEVFSTLYAYHTAGYDDPASAGPQMSLLTSSYWSLRKHSQLISISPSPQTYAVTPGTYPIYFWMAFQDEYRNWVNEYSTMDQILFPALWDNAIGRSGESNVERWFAVNAYHGGATKMDARTGSAVWGNNAAAQAILYFLAFDPSLSAPSDPRTNYNLDYYSAPLGRYVGKTDWTPNQSWFSFLCSWQKIDHQVGNCGLIEFWRKGEFLLHELTSYSFQNEQYQPQYHNTLAIQQQPGASYKASCNPSANTCSNWIDSVYSGGGQWWTYTAGDPVVKASYGPTYAFIDADMTNLYNAPNKWVAANNLVDVQSATRSTLWMKESDTIVIYDRARTGGTNQFKRFNLQLTGTPSTNGNLTTVTQNSGQQLFITALLPNSATTAITTGTSDAVTQVADPKLVMNKYQVTDTANPADVRFLHVLEAKDTGVARSATQLARSSSGTCFDGAVIGATLALFKKNASDTFSSLVYEASGATTHYVAGLAPNHSYSVTKDGITVELSSDSAGLLTFTASGSGQIVIH